jgi:Protein of unknown function (DUF3540)
MGHLNEFRDLSILLNEPLASCLVARVAHVHEEKIELMLAEGRVSAQRAVSCLIALQSGDTVSVIRDNGNVHYVTAVLKRETDGELQLFSQRALAIRSASSIHLVAVTSIELDASKRVAVRAPQFEAVVGRFAAYAKTVTVATGEALLNCKLSRLCSELIDIAAQRIGVSAKHSHRQIEGTEQLRCRYLDLQATEIAHLRAKTTLVKSKDLVKIDAAQIQIG